jgi:hypothetical protein
MYHKVVAYKDDYGKVCLGIYQQGVSESALPALDVGKPVRVRDEGNGLLHHLEAVTTESGGTDLKVQQAGTFV